MDKIHIPRHHHSRAGLLEKPVPSPTVKQYCHSHKEGWTFSEPTTRAVGELYVAVVGGTEIVDGSFGTHSFVSLRLEDAGWDLRTCVRNGKDPIWNEEFVFAVRDLAKPLLINVHGFHPQKTLGIAKTSVDLKQLLEDGVTDHVLTLDQFWGPGHGQIHLKIRFTPDCIPALSGLRLPSFRVVLENSKVFAGDLIQGFVCYNTYEPKDIVSIRLKFRGASVVYWEAYHEYPSYEAELIYFDKVTNVYGPPEHSAAKMTLPAGFHVWPFRFQLPRNIPPTFNQDWVQEDEERAENFYSIHAYIKTHHDHEHYDESTQRITVLAPNKYLVSGTDNHVREKGDEHVRLSLNVPPVVYIGEPFTATVTVENTHTSHKVSEVKVEIFKTLVMHADTCHPKHKNIQHGHEFKFVDKPHQRHYTEVVLHNKIHRRLESHIMPGDNWTGGATFFLRDQTVPSIPDHVSPLIQVNYEIQVTAKIHGLTFLKSRMSKPLMVLHRTSGSHQELYQQVEGEEAETGQEIFKSFIPSEDDLFKLVSMPVVRAEHSRIFCLASREWPKNVTGHLYEPEQWALGEESIQGSTAPVTTTTVTATNVEQQKVEEVKAAAVESKTSEAKQV